MFHCVWSNTDCSLAPTTDALVRTVHFWLLIICYFILDEVNIAMKKWVWSGVNVDSRTGYVTEVCRVDDQTTGDL